MEDSTSVSDIENDLFSFESDHLALKGNEDYCEVLKTLMVLSAQRERALKDYKTVSELKIQALNDPFGTLEKIQNGIDLGVPPLMELPKLPTIVFEKYKVKVPESDLIDIYSDGTQQVKSESEMKNPNTNNNAWTPEEQKRLEELLQTYPPEPVETRRFQKIAKALGNRTAQQVASRIQKYFLKLYKAGLPIPGRIPKSAERHKKSALHRHQRHNHYLFKPTTFFPELNVPVQMDDLNSVLGPSEESSADIITPTGNYLIRNDYHQSAVGPENNEKVHELQLKLLKRVREVKLEEQADGYVPFSHIGFRCDYCDESPVPGTRWHCTVCPESVDFCTDCVISQMYSETCHPIYHWLSIYKDETESSSLFEDFSESSQGFNKQINEELKSGHFEVTSDLDDSSE